jgi:BirA family biotin operon repressor/biotin-[acetyl-CoA-carboxylase] ligase
MYDLGVLEAELAGTIFAGQLHFSPVTGSTNTDAMAAARGNAVHGSVYFCDEQTAGRGRGDHRWRSAAGEGLYVSVILRPQLPMARFALLPLAVGLAAADAVSAVSGLTVDLRWPNDLLLGPRKMGGILVESRVQTMGTEFAVVGIGMNVHQRGFEPGLDTQATSLDMETGRRIERQSLLAVLLKSLEREAQLLADSMRAKMIPARAERGSTWVRGRRVHVHGPQACTGITAGLDENGFLRVDTAQGRVTVQSGGIRAAELE